MNFSEQNNHQAEYCDRCRCEGIFANNLLNFIRYAFPNTHQTYIKKNQYTFLFSERFYGLILQNQFKSGGLQYLKLLKMSFYYIWIFIILLYWLAAALYARTIANACFKRARKLQGKQIPQAFQAFSRKNITPQNEKKILWGCFIRFPLNSFLIVSYLTVFALLVIFKHYIKLPKFIVEIFRKKVGRLVYKICVNTTEQFDAFELVQTPIVISNHTSWLQTIYYGTFPQLMSSIGKQQLTRMPVFNILMEYIRCIYVKRQSVDSRLQAMQKIKDRVNKFNNKTQLCPLIIYAEGTVSNGESVLKFKSGAFEPLAPITIFSYQFQSQQFHPQMADVKLIESFVMSLAVRPSLRVKKSVIHPNPDETVTEYQQRCRQRLAQQGNFTIREASFGQLKQFMNFLTQSRDGEAKMK